MAFSECCNLKTFELNEGIQEVGWLCLLGTGVTDLRLPSHVKRTREQLGLDQDPKVLRLPHGLEVVGKSWFYWGDKEKLFIPNTVRELGEEAFDYCELREVVFEAGSQLETIRNCCFRCCGLEEVTIPKSVRNIGNYAFGNYPRLRSFTFEEGSQLAHVGKDIVGDTQLDEKDVEFPSTAQVDRSKGIKFGFRGRTVV